MTFKSPLPYRHPFNQETDSWVGYVDIYFHVFDNFKHENEPEKLRALSSNSGANSGTFLRDVMRDR